MQKPDRAGAIAFPAKNIELVEAAGSRAAAGRDYPPAVCPGKRGEIARA